LNTTHIPVLSSQVIQWFDPSPGKTFIDCTLGLGGHAKLLLEKMEGKGALYGIEADERNLQLAKENLKPYSNAHFVHNNFEALEDIGNSVREKEGKIDGILFDLGLSSPHVDDGERGFSFQKEGPLDMRFDPRQSLTAAEIINTYTQDELISIFKAYGEERHPYKIAEKIVEHRRHGKFSTTSELANFIAAIFSHGKKDFFFKRHPATRIFQALRIAVNREMEVLGKGLYAAINVLSKGGRIEVISYHSIEDRIVKHLFKDQAKEGIIKILTKKPIKPEREEVLENRRSRSACLRIAEKL
jgi:16S rRNA (cytosine1402-N4)-methyltransferase